MPDDGDARCLLTVLSADKFSLKPMFCAKVLVGAVWAKAEAAATRRTAKVRRENMVRRRGEKKLLVKDGRRLTVGL
jgi:hypothetical protein